MRLYRLLEEAGITDICNLSFPDREITGISCDSRTVRKGEIFVALRGLRYDGGRFAFQARQRGASLIVSEQQLQGEVLVVEDARRALAALCDAWYGHPGKDLCLIGITGTNGKTSTAFMLEWILREAGEHVGLIGTVCCRANGEVLDQGGKDGTANMTTPDPIDLYRLLYEMKVRGMKYVIMEVTSHALHFSKVAPLHFKRAVFTNLSAEHLDLHLDMEEYFYQKQKLFSQCEAAVVSKGTPFGGRLCESLECPLLEISSETVRNIKQNGTSGVSFELLGENGGFWEISVPVPGEFTVENAALAAAVALSLEIPPSTVQKALSLFPGVRGRMERIREEALDITAFLDYAHTPDALEKLLKSIRSFASEKQRIVVLFGCGGDRDRGKRREMGRIASRLADFVILSSDNVRGEEPERILSDILKGIDKEKPYTVIPDRREAILYAVEHARTGEILVLAGKGHEEYEIRGEERLPFSEREILMDALRVRAKKADHNEN